MKKLLPILLSLLLLSACQTPPRIVSPTSEVPVASTTPAYPPFSVYDSTLLDGLNLDGVGDGDDSALAMQYYMADESGEYSVAFTLLQVTLGTGTTWVKKYEGFQDSELSTGYLTNVDRACLILHLTNRISNYGATDVHVLELWESPQSRGAFGLAECLTVLDGDTGYDGQSDQHYPFLFRIPNPNCRAGDIYSKYLSTITRGGGVVDLPGHRVQGLEVMTHASMQEDVGHVLRWDGAQWYIDGVGRQTLATISLDGPPSETSAPEDDETICIVSDLDGDGTEEQVVYSKIGTAPYCSLLFQQDGAQHQVNVLELMQEQFPEWQSLRGEETISGDGTSVWLDFRYWLDGDRTQYGCRVVFTGDSLVVTE